MNTFSAGGLISAGWDTFKKRGWFFIGITLLTIVIEVALRAVTAPLTGSEQYVALIINILFGTLISIGLVSIFLKATGAPESVTFSDLWHPASYWYYLGAELLSGLCIALGFILLIIPGLILAIMWFFVKYLVIDKNLTPIAAMKESARMTKGHRWDLLAFLLLIIIINIIGVLCIVVGLLITIPVTGLATAHAYRALSKTA